jgi:glutamate dehydrogenase/leucine dehydrogenase
LLAGGPAASLDSPGKTAQTIPASPAFTVEVRDESEGLEAYVCIHSIGEWGSSGGMRCVDDVTRAEVELLARAMTFKFSFFGIPQGGAKAGLRLPYGAPPRERERLIRAAARHLEPLLKRSNLWSVWTDMNFYADDLRLFRASIGLPPLRPVPSAGSSSMRTAITAFWSMQACASYFAHSRPTTVAMEGYGGVGQHLADMLVNHGFSIRAISNHLGAVRNPRGLDLSLIAEAKRCYGANWINSKGPWETIPRADLWSMDVDILVPGARVHSIDDALASRVQAKLVVPVANVPCTPRALETLDHHGILYLPDFVVGGGGVCGWIRSANDDFGLAYREMMVRLLHTAESRGVAPRHLCEQVAHQGFAAIQSNAYRSVSIGQRLLARARRMLPLNAMRERHAFAANMRAHAERLELLFQDSSKLRRSRSLPP